MVGVGSGVVVVVPLTFPTAVMRISVATSSPVLICVAEILTCCPASTTGFSASSCVSTTTLVSAFMLKTSFAMYTLSEVTLVTVPVLVVVVFSFASAASLPAITRRLVSAICFVPSAVVFRALWATDCTSGSEVLEITSVCLSVIVCKRSRSPVSFWSKATCFTIATVCSVCLASAEIAAVFVLLSALLSKSVCVSASLLSAKDSLRSAFSVSLATSFRRKSWVRFLYTYKVLPGLLAHAKTVVVSIPNTRVAPASLPASVAIRSPWATWGRLAVVK